MTPIIVSLATVLLLLMFKPTRIHYLHAHQIAMRAERDAVRAAGVSWWAYQSFMKKHEKQIEEEKPVRIPGTLDLTPYRDEKDFGLLERLVRNEKVK
jgi:hypothetical protein